MARDLETLLAQVQKSIAESKAMILVTRQMVENSRQVLRGQVAESPDPAADKNGPESAGTPIGDSPEQASGEL
ncbi:MAG TPA: hypothetical protein VGE29_07695 [Prosthecobacter sp.]